jgi:hypothetical protein
VLRSVADLLTCTYSARHLLSHRSSGSGAFRISNPHPTSAARA